mmetsp:Transcript_12964/g.27946  ORF Transcript_12964/g.27946 Transcript_12964/m.27946 type:complete len:252 (+) Transcript_12964:721-1476(+)|eukprot:CAMPEP_0196132638 /NCGR_PEP_ID=MMETSP0910-20130528/2173_1 /TAXON_ID=49265 /ORGANISM="Thalassiosira rotula, Strain GSO102" /LENGTH=251 /DNA_ID=CAMNT_0041392259 /DNA_START=121 /DNA_END=876 /DNA_ORIENTATION=+
MNPISRSTTAMLSAIASLLLLSTAMAFSPTTNPLHNAVAPHYTAHSSTRPSNAVNTVNNAPPLRMSLNDVSDFYAQFPLQAAVLTCGVKASVADGIAQVRSDVDNLEFRRNLAYIIYGGIFIGALCHYEYDVLFPLLFGSEHSLTTSFREVIFDNFVSGPFVWLPPAYLIKAIVYDYPLREGVRKYTTDVTEHGLLQKYWTVWIPAQSVSFTVVPDHLRVAFMACVSFFWFIIFSTVSSSSSAAEDGASGD